jgi:uncharacterized membrane protein
VTRRPYIDWLRGLAVVAMMEWHSIESWSVHEGRDSNAFGWTVFIGGWAAPMFLYLAGVSVALSGASKLRKGLDRHAASWALQKRGWQVFGIAHLFRVQSYLLSRGASWTSLLKPDILNILGLGMVAAGFCWGRASSRRSLAAWLLIPAAAIVLLSPGSRTWWWPTLLHIRLEAYLRPNQAGVFQIFPSLAYVLIGAWLGAFIAEPRASSDEPRFHLTLGVLALATIAAGWIGAYLPPIAATSDFWTTSISMVLLRTGAITAALVVAWVWMRRPSAHRWSPLVLLGRTSLFVYWVHIEIAYGIFSKPIQHTLSLATAWCGFGVLAVVMTVAAYWWARWTPPPLTALVPVGLQSSLRPRP